MAKAASLGRGHGQQVVVDAGRRAHELAAHPQLAEGIGHVAADRIGRGAWRSGRWSRRRPAAPPRARRFRDRRLPAMASIDRCAAAMKPLKILVLSVSCRAVLLQRPQALLIGRGALPQARPEKLLQPGKAIKAKMLGEAHQRRGLHIGRKRRCWRPCRRRSRRGYRAHRPPPASAAWATRPCARGSRCAARRNPAVAALLRCVSDIGCNTGIAIIANPAAIKSHGKLVPEMPIQLITNSGGRHEVIDRRRPDRHRLYGQVPCSGVERRQAGVRRRPTPAPGASGRSQWRISPRKRADEFGFAKVDRRLARR